MQPDLIFCHSEDDPCRLLMPGAVVNELDLFKQIRTDQFEAGGILLGLRRGPHLEVVAATQPMRGDKRTRTSFLRRDPEHFRIAEKIWRNSGGTIGYIGEWHTHPEPRPTPSGIDTSQWRRILFAEQQQTVFIIVGTEAWYVSKGTPSPQAHHAATGWVELNPIDA